MRDRRLTETVAALATAPGLSALSVVRLSGDDALSIADRVVACRGPSPSRRRAGSFFRATLHDPSGAAVDDVVVLVFRAPKSYTGEDVVEFQGHGGPTASRRLVETVLAAGAKPAGPGEFTRRAFLNGKLDLVQAEAVIDLIQAHGDRAADVARSQLNGSLSNNISNIYEELINLCADVEATLDFDELESRPLIEDLAARLPGLNRLRDRVEDLLKTRHEGHVLRDGALVVISGRPNVGKSSLMNALVGHARAIVNPRPGTTRDTIEESLVLHGWPLRVVDTAGLRQRAGAVEMEGMTRARQWIAQADVNLHLLDGSRPFSSQRDATLEELDPARTVMVINKIDRPRRLPNPVPFTQPFRTVEVSLSPPSPSAPSGIEPLQEALLECLHLETNASAHPAVNARHYWVLEQVRDGMAGAIDRMNRHPAGEMDLVLAAEALRRAADGLALVLGRTYSEDLLDRVFSRFCVGK